MKKLGHRSFSPKLRFFFGLGAFLALWVSNNHAIQNAPEHRNRLDRKDQIAIPYSDPGNDFMNAIALLNGDGFVNWRPLTQHQVYKPGWVLVLAGLAYIHDRDLAAMQNTVIWFNALTVPLLYLLCLSLFREQFPSLLSLAAAFIYLFFPFRDWSIHRTLMTEGPTTVLVLQFCLLLAVVCNRKSWPWWLGLLTGLSAGCLELVRTQARYGIIFALIPIIVLVLWRFKKRRSWLLFFFTGYLMLLVPVYGKTAWQLNRWYSGTNYTSLRAVLQFSTLGIEAGGAALTLEEASSEQAASDALSERVSGVIKERTANPVIVWVQGYPWLLQYLFDSLHHAGENLGNRLFRKILFVFAIFAGSLLALFQGRWQVLTLLFFLHGYLAPNYAFNYFLPRFGEPVGWIGLLLVFGFLIQVNDRQVIRKVICRYHLLKRYFRCWRTAWRIAPVSRGRDKSPSRNYSPNKIGIYTLLKLAGCGVISTSLFLFLISIDKGDLHLPGESELIAQTNAVVASTQHETIELIHSQIDSILNGSGEHPDVDIGFVLFPQTMEAGDPPLDVRWRTYPETDSTRTHFLFVVPWKLGGFRQDFLSVEGSLWDSFYQGQPALVYDSGGLRKDSEIQVLVALLPNN